MYVTIILCKNYYFSYWYQLLGIFNTTDNIVVVLLFLILIFIKNKNIFKTIFIFLLIFYHKLYIYNQSILVVIIHNINTNLINGIMLIHPIILYLLYAYILCFFFIYFFFLKKKFIKNINLQQNIKYNYIYSIISLFLGSYWAEQELFWGGW